MAIETILNALDKYKKVGADRYRAPCPVHKGKDNNLMISEDNTGKVGCHCFVCGANGMDVVQALGLPTTELFPPDNNYERPVLTKNMKHEQQMDTIYTMMFENDSQKRQMTLAEKRRYRQAKARLEGINELINRTA